MVTSSPSRVIRPILYVVCRIVSVPPETFRHKKRAHSHTQQTTYDQDSGQSKEESSIFEGIYMCLRRYRSWSPDAVRWLTR